MADRYVLQMSEFTAYRLALYDIKEGEVVAQFKHVHQAETVCLMLNNAEDK